MKRFLPVLSAGLFLVAGCADRTASPAGPDGLGAPPKALLSTSGLDGLDTDLPTTGNHIVLFNRERVPANFAAAAADLGGAIEMTLDAIGVAVVSGLDADAQERLELDNSVRHVFPEIVLRLVEPVDAQVMEAAVAGTPTTDDPSQASFYPQQWHLHQIQAEAAWAAGFTGSDEVVVAILDTGIGYTHPDLVGLVDLERSVSFVPSDDDLVEANFPGAHPVADLHWHGTHVAATVSSNALAAAGVTSKTTLVGVKVCNVGGSCPFGGVLAGVLHAAEIGADVMNLSLGGFSRHRLSPGLIATVERAFNHANRMGTLAVVAAGNNGLDLDHLEDFYFRYCQISATTCVSATAPGDVLAGFSNHGRSAIDVGAPGVSVIAGCSPFSLLFGGVCQTGTFVLSAGGTSMASPHSAGVAALIAAHTRANGPAQTARLLEQTADWVHSEQQRGRTKEFGSGRINAASAVGVN